MKTLNLKKAVFVCSLILIYGTSFSNPIKEKPVCNDSTICLEVIGGAYAKGIIEDKGIKVELIYFNTVVDSTIIEDAKKFKFALKKDSYYAIRISKKGYVPRIISICTKLNEKNEGNVFYQFHFDTELLKEEDSRKLNYDALEFPVAIVNFDEQLGGFYYSEEYTSNIKREGYYKTSNSKKH